MRIIMGVTAKRRLDQAALDPVDGMNRDNKRSAWPVPRTNSETYLGALMNLDRVTRGGFVARSGDTSPGLQRRAGVDRVIDRIHGEHP